MEYVKKISAAKEAKEIDLFQRACLHIPTLFWKRMYSTKSKLLGKLWTLGGGGGFERK